MSLMLACLESLLASLFFGVLFQLRGRLLYTAAVGGGICWLVYGLFCMWIPTSQIPAYFAAAVAVTIFCEICARVQRAPAGVFLAVALIPLVPGGGIYRTMLLCIRGTPAQALAACITTVGIAGAMAFGVVVTSALFRSVIRRKHNL